MTKECNIARDLMPLCADGAASADSADYVAAHTASCPPCADYFARMQAELPANNAAVKAQEQAGFDAAAQKLRKKQFRRALRIVLLGVLLGALLLFGGYEGYMQLYVDNHADFPMTEYGLSLSRLSDGRVVVTADFHDTSRDYSVSASTSFDNPYDGATLIDEPVRINGEMRIGLRTPILPHYNATPNANTPVMVIKASDMDGMMRILRGNSDAIADGRETGELLWQSGDAIPAASEEMEAYYAMGRQIELAYLENQKAQLDAAFSPESADADFEDRVSALLAQQEAIRLTVPEWQ